MRSRLASHRLSPATRSISTVSTSSHPWPKETLTDVLAPTFSRQGRRLEIRESSCLPLLRLPYTDNCLPLPRPRAQIENVDVNECHYDRGMAAAHTRTQVSAAAPAAAAAPPVAASA